MSVRVSPALPAANPNHLRRCFTFHLESLSEVHLPLSLPLPTAAMVSLPQRMRKLQTKLLAIRLGSGAMVLPKEVTRIHMRFARKIDGGHMGPR